MKIYKNLAALSALVAGGLHVSLVSFGHLTAFPPLEFVFFMSVGLAQILWAIFFYKQPQAFSYYFGALLNGGVPIMWLFTRFYTAPFMGGPEHIDALGILVQSLSVLALLFSSFIWFKHAKKAGSHALVVILLAIISGVLNYGAALSMEYVFPDREINHGHGEEEEHMDDEEPHMDTVPHKDEEPHMDEEPHVDEVPHS